jgi:Divergent InlB B-repeat domain
MKVDALINSANRFVTAVFFIIFIALAFFIPIHCALATARASVTIDAGPWGDPVDSQTTNSAAVTTSGSSYILVGITADCTNGCNNNHVVSVTAPGLTFTKLAGGKTPSNEVASEFWGAVSAGPLASVTVTATLSDQSNFALSILSLHNVDVANPVGLTAGPDAMANDLSVTFNGTTAGSMLFATAFSLPYKSNVTAGADTTVYANENGATQHIRSSSAVIGGTQTIFSTGWNDTTAEYAGVEILGAITSYTLTYTAGANGTITGLTPQTVNSGADGTAVTASPNAHYHFVSWSDGVLTASRTDTNITNDLTVTANFAIDTRTLTYIPGANGTITGTNPQTINYGSNGAAVTALPANGYNFVNWSDLSTANPRTDANVTSNLTFTANFAAFGHALSWYPAPAPMPPSIVINKPSNGSYNADAVIGLDWSSANGNFVKYKVYYSSDNGATYATLGETPSTSLSWTVPDVGTTQGKIKVEGYDGVGALLASATSDGNFTVIGEANPEASENSVSPTTPSPSVDPTVSGNYSPAEALENNPDINADKSLSVPITSNQQPITTFCASGSLIKGSLPAVYYCGADGKRYIFVNDKAYFSWYADFSGVKIISDDDLAKIPFGGNITYRPGARLVKIQSDAKVYAIARGGILRWVSSGSIALKLYGANWTKMVDDIPESFFVNYTVGEPL